ncbi:MULTISPECIES: DUF397 domain-containing protein [Streptomyces]|uniref:DUF397 domain-containing protein n=1 Tax=Streptomyces tendae TaxID=1932 RepID=A0ABX5ZVW0_STRTE|nr:DUF397 domain-containing protein [Streptomyces tendae]QER88759.1 DUF397 domain-containing protein [Streptomyces tendae]
MDTAPSPRNSQWRKSSYSGNTGGDCVEVDLTDAAVIPVRDSKNPAGPVVTVGVPAWQAFLGSLRRH